MPGIIHKVRSQVNNSQHLRSKSWKPNNANWIRQLRGQIKSETRGLQVQNISFTTKNRTNTRTGYCCLSLTFALHKTEYNPNLFVMMNQKL